MSDMLFSMDGASSAVIGLHTGACLVTGGMKLIDSKNLAACLANRFLKAMKISPVAMKALASAECPYTRNFLLILSL